MTSLISSLPPPTAYQRRPIRAVNWVWRQLQEFGFGRFEFNAQKMLDDASTTTGLDDFGDSDFLDGLNQYLTSVNNQSQLNPLGQYLTYSGTLRLLNNRLWAEQLIKENPDILDMPFQPPVVVLGLARSGTTRLHRLLACDEQFLNLKSWESVHPVPWTESNRNDYANDPRISSIDSALKAVMYLGPQIAAIHPLGAHEVEEEVGLIQHGFESPIFNTMTHTPGYAIWQMEHDNIASYRYMKRLMQLISWYRKDDVSKPWVLKTPQHMQDLSSLMQVFPNAKLLCTHRDPVKAVGSICSTAWNSLVRDQNSLNPFDVGEEWFTLYQNWVDHAHSVRTNDVSCEQQIDILYEGINKNWRTEISRIYAYLDIPLTEKTLNTMQNWLDDSGEYKPGGHKYSLADFGLNESNVEAAFSQYRERHQIPFENKNRFE